MEKKSIWGVRNTVPKMQLYSGQIIIANPDLIIRSGLSSIYHSVILAGLPFDRPYYTLYK